MFSEINGLPVHPLVVHAAVVLVPLAALLGVLFAIPRTRAWSRLPLLLVSLAALVSVYVARQSGFKLQQALIREGSAGGVAGQLIGTHRMRASYLFYFMIGFAILAVVAYVVTRSAKANQTLVLVISVLLVIGSGLLAFQVYRVGEIGARAVWNPI